MSERRKWDKQSEFYPPTVPSSSRGGVDPYASASVNGAAANDPVLEKQRQYIKMLEERNRLKKKLARASKSQKEKSHLQEREEAFVTTFNVPKAAGTGVGHHVHGSSSISSSSTVRKNKSAASLLPTRMAPSACTSSSSVASLSGRNFDDERQSECKSAPSTTLSFQQTGDLSARGSGGEQHYVRGTATRAKWSKPQGPMNIAVENRDGRAHFCLTDQVQTIGAAGDEESDAKDVAVDVGDKNSRLDVKNTSVGDEDEDDDQSDHDSVEQSYLEESFEEFEEEENGANGEQNGCEEEILAEAKEPEVSKSTLHGYSEKESKFRENVKFSVKPSDSRSDALNASIPMLSQTTTELFDIIHHLSRSKQKALMDVLQRFQASEQRESDVKELQSSIGDPEIWNQLTATLFNSSTKTTTVEASELATGRQAKQHSETSDKRLKPVDGKPISTSLVQILDEQKKWEEEYAQQMKARLKREREEKEKAMQEAEERRMAMMKQLEEEEKELERLMEQKRQERLLKLRALEQDIESVPEPLLTTSAASVPKRKKKEAVESKLSRTENPGSNAVDQKPPKDIIKPRACASTEREEAEKRGNSVSPTKRSPKKKLNKERQSGCSLEHDLLVALIPDAKPTSVEDAEIAISRNTKPAPIVPPLKLGFASTSLSTTQSISTSSSVELRVKLLTTWGKTRAVGLTQVSVYDVNGVELDVDMASLKLFDQSESQPLPKSHDMVRSLGRLFNGIAHTNNEQDMWLGRLSDTGALQISFEVPATPSKLCVWNYNSLSKACARDVEVLVSGKCVWTGSLPETFGDEDESLCIWINVMASGKKTARTARQDDRAATSRSPTSFAVTDSKDPSAATQSAQINKSNSGIPLWLSDSISSSATLLTSREVSSNYSEAKQLDLLAAEEKSLSGSLTARHRYQSANEVGSNEWKRANADGSKEIDWQQRSSCSEREARERAARENAIEATHRQPNSLESDSRHRAADGLSSQLRSSSSSMWDSLEHFSKTNRSRLPQTTNDDGTCAEPLSTTRVTMKADGKDVSELRRLASSKTSSALLSELKSMSLTPYGPGIGNSPSSVAKSSLKSSASSSSFAAPNASPDDIVKTPNIPVLPSGTRLKLEILSTWGDPHYVGLNGIDLFDQHGRLISFQNPEQQVRACPASINELDEYSDDPRVAKNLVDGVNFTCDDFHMWLAPFTLGEEHFVELEMDAKTSISMIRVWNYNKSRAHSFRGVRHARLILYESKEARAVSTSSRPSSSGAVIFEGEISKALGLVSTDSIDQSCEVILFTRDEVILHAIESNDDTLMKYAQNNGEEEETSLIVANLRSSMEMQRPRTSDKGASSGNEAKGLESYHDYINGGNNEEPSLVTGKNGRPTTAVARSHAIRRSVASWTSIDAEPQEKSPVLKVSEKYKEDDNEGQEDDDDSLVRGRRLTIKLLTTWGDTNYIGLTQLDVLVGKNGVPFPLNRSQIDATPRDLESLIDGVGTTCDDAHMWLVPLSSSQNIRIDLKKDQLIYGLRIWNYNKSSEDTFRGVKQLHVSVDGLLVSPKESGFVIRKAPGITLFDFDQVVRFENRSSTSRNKCSQAPSCIEGIHYPLQIRTYKTPIIRQDYEPSLFPQGFLLKFIFWTTWGDPYYLGLNGIEIYDFHGKKLQFAPQVIAAKPYSISEISKSTGAEEDVRVPENLLNGKNKNTWDASDAWLAPLASSLGNYEGNIVYMAFDTPVVISMIKFWNYSKTPERGVKEIDIYLDDLHLYSGTLRKAPQGGDGHNVGRMGTKVHVTEEFSQPILFSTNQAQVDVEKRKVLYCGMEEQDVLCINEGQVMQESKAMYRKPDPGAEGVVVDLRQRPMTALCRH